jgi:hypothetical protein
MSVGLAELHRALIAVWNLPYALRSGTAMPGDSFPYVVFQQSASNIAVRMSGSGVDAGAVRRVHDVPWEFRCYATGSALLSPKEQAASVAEEVVKIYGGHPTVAPREVAMTSGDYLISQMMSEFDVKVGEDEHMWAVVYNFKVDLPVKV